MTLDESIQGMRLQIIRRAAAIGVSAACREAGISRTLFYRWQHRVSRYGVDGLHPRRLQARPGPAPQLPPAVERRLLAVAIAEATWGAARLAAYAQRLWRLQVAPSTVQRLLRRHGLATRRHRLLVLEHHSATQAGLLTERTRQALWRLRHGRTRHVAAERPGELLCLDTFYIGHLKGVGKVWQITACDAASSYGIARILPALSPAATARFLRDVLMPVAQRAGWPVQRVLTDRGNEFKADFATTCAALGIRQTRIKTRHAWTNGFVERCSKRFSLSTGAWLSGAVTSPAARRWIAASWASCSSTTLTGRIMAIESAAARPRRSSTARWRPHGDSGTAKVSTPTRIWTV